MSECKRFHDGDTDVCGLCGHTPKPKAAARECWLHPNAIDTLSYDGAEYRAAIAAKQDHYVHEKLTHARGSWIRMVEATNTTLAAEELARELREVLLAYGHTLDVDRAERIAKLLAKIEGA